MEIVSSKLFDQFPELVFGMSTVDGGVSHEKFGLNLSYHVGDVAENVEENRKRFFSSLGIQESRIAFTQQTHSSTTVVVNAPGKYPDSDALIARHNGLFLAVSAADCTPVMFYDPDTGTIGGIHAGWKGTSLRIVENALHTAMTNFSVDSSNLYVFIGPSAGQCCYEVGEDVARRFPPECVKFLSTAKYLLDVKKANYLQLLECGVRSDRIEIHPDCSIHNQKYHSHRRDGKRSGRMMAVIGLKK
ncbi:MAG: peptidoglycan editing factor PgeF [Bacteroidota bacterium]|jgi:hypothetical protein